MEAAQRRSSVYGRASSDEDSIDVLRQQVMTEINRTRQGRKQLFNHLSQLDFTLRPSLVRRAIEKSKKAKSPAKKNSNVTSRSPTFQRPPSPPPRNKNERRSKVVNRPSTSQESAAISSEDSGIQRSIEPIERPVKKSSTSTKPKEKPAVQNCNLDESSHDDSAGEAYDASGDDTFDRVRKKLMEDLVKRRSQNFGRLFNKKPTNVDMKLRRSVVDRARKKAAEINAQTKVIVSSTPAPLNKQPTTQNNSLNLSPITKDTNRSIETRESSVKPIGNSSNVKDSGSCNVIELLSSYDEENISRASQLHNTSSGKRKRSQEPSASVASSISSEKPTKRSRLHSFVAALSARKSESRSVSRNLSRCLSRKPFLNLEIDIENDVAVDENEFDVRKEIDSCRIGKKIIPKSSNVLADPWRIRISDLPSDGQGSIDANYSRNRLIINPALEDKLVERGGKPKKSFVNRKTMRLAETNDVALRHSNLECDAQIQYDENNDNFLGGYKSNYSGCSRNSTAKSLDETVNCNEPNEIVNTTNSKFKTFNSSNSAISTKKRGDNELINADETHKFVEGDSLREGKKKLNNKNKGKLSVKKFGNSKKIFEEERSVLDVLLEHPSWEKEIQDGIEILEGSAPILDDDSTNTKTGSTSKRLSRSKNSKRKSNNRTRPISNLKNVIVENESDNRESMDQNVNCSKEVSETANELSLTERLNLLRYGGGNLSGVTPGSTLNRSTNSRQQSNNLTDRNCEQQSEIDNKKNNSKSNKSPKRTMRTYKSKDLSHENEIPELVDNAENHVDASCIIEESPVEITEASNDMSLLERFIRLRNDNRSGVQPEPTLSSSKNSRQQSVLKQRTDKNLEEQIEIDNKETRSKLSGKPSNRTQRASKLDEVTSQVDNTENRVNCSKQVTPEKVTESIENMSLIERMKLTKNKSKNAPTEESLRDSSCSRNSSKTKSNRKNTKTRITEDSDVIRTNKESESAASVKDNKKRIPPPNSSEEEMSLRRGTRIRKQIQRESLWQDVFLTKKANGWKNEEISKSDDGIFKVPTLPPKRTKKSSNVRSSSTPRDGEENSRKTSKTSTISETRSSNSGDESCNPTTSVQVLERHDTTDCEQVEGTDISKSKEPSVNNNSVSQINNLKMNIVVKGSERSIVWGGLRPRFKCLDASENNKIWYANTLRDHEEGISSGLIKLGPGAKKPKQVATYHALTFVVISGSCEVFVYNEQHVFAENNSFLVPNWCEYSIKNLSQTDHLLMHFTRLRSTDALKF